MFADNSGCTTSVGNAPYASPMHVLFVCTGNVFHSPMAERLAVAYAEELGVTDLTAESAGTQATEGSPMEPTAAQVLAGLGGDPSGFAARLLTEQTAAGADLVLTMTEGQREQVLSLAPTQAAKTFTLRQAARIAAASGAATVAELVAARPGHEPSDSTEDVADPVGLDEETFQTVGSEIADLMGLLARNVRS